jgi:coenzyme Q-binding protein COQ10
MAKIERHIFVNAPIEKVYAFARDPRSWNAWFAGLSAPELIVGTGEKGTAVKHHYTVAGMTFPVTTRVIDDRPGPKAAHWRVRSRGHWPAIMTGRTSRMTTRPRSG